MTQVFLSCLLWLLGFIGEGNCFVTQFLAIFLYVFLTKFRTMWLWSVDLGPKTPANNSGRWTPKQRGNLDSCQHDANDEKKARHKTNQKKQRGS